MAQVESLLRVLVAHPDHSISLIAPFEDIPNIRGRSQDALTSMGEDRVLDLLKDSRMPMRGSPSRIVGWGAYSVAVGIDSSVVVVKQLRKHTTLPGSEILPDSVKQDFSQWLTPSLMFIGHGFNNKPAFMKISREIIGDTLSDTSIFEILADKSILVQLRDIYTRTLLYLARTGKILDTTGTRSDTIIANVANDILPFRSKNMLIQYGSGKISIVDWGVGLDIVNKRKSLFHLCHALTKCTGILTSVITANTFLGLHYLRDNLFKDNHPIVEERKNFEDGFANVIGFLEQNSIDYRVVGHFALAGWLNSHGFDYDLSPRRPNGTIRDVDIIVLGLDPQEVKDLNRRFNKDFSQKNGFPEISLSPVFKDKDIKSWGRRGKYNYNYMSQDGTLHKRFGSKQVAFSVEDMNPAHLTMFGVTFKTFSEDVIAALYFTRGGGFKMKDLHKIHLLFTQTQFVLKDAWVNMHKEVTRDYPVDVLRFQLTESAYFWTGGYVSVLKQFVKRCARIFDDA